MEPLHDTSRLIILTTVVLQLVTHSVAGMVDPGTGVPRFELYNPLTSVPTQAGISVFKLVELL